MTTPRLKHPAPQSFRLSRETLNILDRVAEDLGRISRRGAVEILARFIDHVSREEGLTFSQLLVNHRRNPPDNGS